jgi:hypothetical protein
MKILRHEVRKGKDLARDLGLEGLVGKSIIVYGVYRVKLLT